VASDLRARGGPYEKAAGTLAGHAAGEEPTTIDPAAVVRALGTGTTDVEDPGPVLPEPLASVVEHLGAR
jgi:DNA segregation ATPase FtsK/SpoIIIE, S-DNA-T family